MLIFIFLAIQITKPFDIHRETFVMGSPMQISVSGSNTDSIHLIINQVFNYFLQMEEKYSWFNDRSKLSDTNYKRKTHLHKLDKEFYQLLSIAKWAYQNSNGIFDISVKGIYDYVFNSQSIDSAVFQNIIDKRVGFNKINFDNEVLIFENDSMALDLNGLLVGYCLDSAKKKLLNAPYIHHFFINHSGDMLFENKLHADSLIIYLDEKKNEYLFLEAGYALSSSGSINNYRQIRKRSYGHIFNPHKRQFNTVSGLTIVIAKSALVSDIFSTVFYAEKTSDTDDIFILDLFYPEKLNEIRVQKFPRHFSKSEIEKR